MEKREAIYNELCPRIKGCFQINDFATDVIKNNNTSWEKESHITEDGRTTAHPRRDGQEEEEGKQALPRGWFIGNWKERTKISIPMYALRLSFQTARHH